MADYSNLNLLKMATGSNSGGWGTRTNENWDRIDSFSSGYISISIASITAYTLDTAEGEKIDAEGTAGVGGGTGWNKVIKFTGNPGGTCDVTIRPLTSERWYFVTNANGSGHSIRFTQEAVAPGTNYVTLADGYSTIIYADGGNVYRVLDNLETATIKATTFIGALTGTASLVSVTDNSADTAFPVVFNDESNALLDDTGAFTYNPNSSTLVATTFSGNATTATKLDTARAINGVDFNGTIPITVTAAAGTLTGATLASGVTASSLTSIGTVATGVWNGTSIGTSYTDAKVESVVAGNLIDVSGATGDVTVNVDLDELSTSTSDADGDYFAVVDTSNAQKKLTKANIDISGFNDAVATAITGTGALNAGSITSGFGSINVGSSAITTTGTLTADLTGTVLTATQGSITTAASLTTVGTVENGTWSSDITMGSGDNLEVDGGTIKLDGNFPEDEENVFMGSDGGASIAAGGCENTGIGDKAGRYITTGAGNTFVGHKAGTSDVTNKLTGDANVGLGASSLNNVTTGQYNTAIGSASGHALVGGSSNVMIGRHAGYGTNRSSNILIGPEVGTTDIGADSILVIDDGNQASDQNKKYFIYGDMANGTFRMNAEHDLTNHQFTISNRDIDVSGGGSILKLDSDGLGATTFNYIECGEPTGSSLVFKVRGDGNVYNDNEVYSTPADYADMFEWSDGNPDAEDRIGLSVVLDGEGGIRIATGSDAAEDVVGIVSGTACMVGNAAWSKWDKTFLKDDFGRPTDQPNPDYDESLEYVPRGDRAEWAIIGLTGRVHLRKGSPAHPSWRKIRDVSAVTEEWLVR